MLLAIVTIAALGVAVDRTAEAAAAKSTVAWSAELQHDTSNEYEHLNLGFPLAVHRIDSKRYYVVDRQSGVNAINLNDGTLAWRYNPGSLVTYHVYEGSNRVIIDTGDGLIAIDATNANVKWQNANLSFGIDPIVVNGTAILFSNIQQNENSLIVMDIASGKIVFDQDGPLGAVTFGPYHIGGNIGVLATPPPFITVGFDIRTMKELWTSTAFWGNVEGHNGKIAAMANSITEQTNLVTFFDATKGVAVANSTYPGLTNLILQGPPYSTATSICGQVANTTDGGSFDSQWALICVAFRSGKLVFAVNLTDMYQVEDVDYPCFSGDHAVYAYHTDATTNGSVRAYSLSSGDVAWDTRGIPQNNNEGDFVCLAEPKLGSSSKDHVASHESTNKDLVFVRYGEGFTTLNAASGAVIHRVNGTAALDGNLTKIRVSSAQQYEGGVIVASGKMVYYFK